jgi:hypothetical protein
VALDTCARVRPGLAGNLEILWRKLEACSSPSLDVGLIPELLPEQTEALVGKPVVREDGRILGKIRSLLDGGTKVHFGGPGRGCDYGDTWVFTREVHKLQDGTLVYVPE